MKKNPPSLFEDIVLPQELLTELEKEQSRRAKTKIIENPNDTLRIPGIITGTL